MTFFVPDAQLSNQAADRFEYRVQRVAVAGEDHPRSERSRALAAEDIERAVDDVARVCLPVSRFFDRIGDGRGYGFSNRAREIALQTGGGTEVMEEVGVGSPDLRSNSLQCDCLRTLFQQ